MHETEKKSEWERQERLWSKKRDGTNRDAEKEKLK